MLERAQDVKKKCVKGAAKGKHKVVIPYISTYEISVVADVIGVIKLDGNSVKIIDVNSLKRVERNKTISFAQRCVDNLCSHAPSNMDGDRYLGSRTTTKSTLGKDGKSDPLGATR